MDTSTRTTSRSVIRPKLVLGLILILIGMAFSLDRLGVVRAENIFDLWPVILIVAGLGKAIWPASPTSRFVGLLMAFVGTWLLLEFLDVIYYSFFDYWPVFLVVAGIAVVWQGMRGSNAIQAPDDRSTVNAVAMLGGSNRTVDTTDFRGGDLIAFMGGVGLDLTAARITHSPAVIDAFAMWGGVEIVVPDSWTVTVRGLPLLGGYEDSRRKADRDPEQELIVKGMALMGGVEVKSG